MEPDHETNLGIVPFLAEEEDAGGEVREGVWEAVGTAFVGSRAGLVFLFVPRARPLVRPPPAVSVGATSLIAKPKSTSV